MLCTFTPRSKSQTQLVNYKYVCGKSQSTLQREGTDTLKKKKKFHFLGPKQNALHDQALQQNPPALPHPTFCHSTPNTVAGLCTCRAQTLLPAKPLPLPSWRPSLGRLLWLQTESINPHCSPSLPHAAHTLTAAHATMNCNYALPSSVTLPHQVQSSLKERGVRCPGQGLKQKRRSVHWLLSFFPARNQVSLLFNYCHISNHIQNKSQNDNVQIKAPRKMKALVCYNSVTCHSQSAP